MNLDLSREHVSSSHDASTPSVTDRGRASRSSALRGLSFSAGEAALSPVQARDGAVGGGGDAQTVAAGGTAAARSGGLPHLAAIQRSFGGHDVSGVKAAVGGRAGDACAELGASAYAQGESVAFGASPSLHTAAHEAAHVVQQR
ncbi:MAG: DUF4157 domain-containing protein, partial [Myxococcales bacterium]|nr:DUF4157 domain-containing protein [Myxococcales bacterium]